MSKFLVIAGMWFVLDGWFSMALYWKDVNWKGNKQTFWHDHYIRLIRILFGLGVIIVGCIYG